MTNFLFLLASMVMTVWYMVLTVVHWGTDDVKFYIPIAFLFSYVAVAFMQLNKRE